MSLWWYQANYLSGSQGDSNLSTVKLGKVAEIEGYAFSSCNSLTQIDFKAWCSAPKQNTLCAELININLI